MDSYALINAKVAKGHGLVGVAIQTSSSITTSERAVQ